MADLLAILNSGAYGLSAHRGAAAVASHNLQNANTPGYARQRAELAAVLPGGALGGALFGRGVALSGVSQARDRFLEWQIPGATAARAHSAAESQTLAAVSVFDPTGEGGLSQAISDLQQALRDLSQNPGDEGMRRAALTSARSLAMAFNRTAESLAATRGGLDQSIDASVQEVGRLTRQMAELNTQIRVARGSGTEPNDLLDARLRLRDRLAELTGGRSVEDGEGNLNVFLPSGAALVSGDVSTELTTEPDPASRGHLAVKLARPGGASVLDARALGGRLGGLLSARDGALAQAESGVDKLAFELATSLNAVHGAGVARDGSAGMELFTGASEAQGAAARIAVEPMILASPALLAAATGAAGASGDATNVLALLGALEGGLPSGKGAGAELAALAARFGSETARAEAAAGQDATLEGHLVQMREATSGVSIDEELIEMTKAQRGFEAVSRVIQAADEMLETLMRLGS